MPSPPAPFDALVLAGGGCRCFWQVGFLETASDRLPIRPRRVAAVSAGSAMAVLWLSGRAERARRCFAALTAANPRNLYPERLFGPRPVFPHLAMYSHVLRDALDPEALQTLAAAPPIDVLLARPPEPLPPALALALGFGAYLLERRLREPLHPAWPRSLGFTPQLVRLQDRLADHPHDPRAAAEAVIDLVLASSCTPPVTPLLRYQNRPVFDGGLIDNVPAFAVDPLAQRALVLLTRPLHARSLPAHPHRCYVQPSRPVPIDKWDYTRPDLLDAAYQLGRHDGERFDPDAGP